MKKINLRDYYPFYKSDYFIDVPDETERLLYDFKRQESAYHLRTYRHKAYYSLDRGDGIERDILFLSLSPCEIYERKVSCQELYSAIASLPDKQAKRIYAYYFLGISKAEIARTEDVAVNAVKDAISRGLKNIEKFLKKFM